MLLQNKSRKVQQGIQCALRTAPHASQPKHSTLTCTEQPVFHVSAFHNEVAGFSHSISLLQSHKQHAPLQRSSYLPTSPRPTVSILRTIASCRCSPRLVAASFKSTQPRHVHIDWSHTYPWPTNAFCTYTWLCCVASRCGATLSSPGSTPEDSDSPHEVEKNAQSRRGTGTPCYRMRCNGAPQQRLKLLAMHTPCTALTGHTDIAMLVHRRQHHAMTAACMQAAKESKCYCYLHTSNVNTSCTP